jgi:glutamyl-tRNA(Gln) amidotransferase subunit E
MDSAAEVEKVAYAIGTILRATRKVKRGLGSIRQDLNISTPGGALMEIKGVQELEILSKAVETEINRQLKLLEIRDELSKRGAKSESIERKYYDVTSAFASSKARIIKEAISKGGVVLGLRLPKFRGLLGKELAPGLRLGTELSNRASFWASVGGIFHSDELPGYGVTEEEVHNVKDRLSVTGDDAFVLVADEKGKANDALNAVVDGAVEAISGVPEETRTAMPDGTTRYMRPRPGAARMYPETDVPQTSVPQEFVTRLKANLPETPEKLTKRLVDQYSLNQKLSKQLVDSDYLVLFEQIANASKVPPTFIATVLTETCKSLEREGVPIHSIPDNTIQRIFGLVDEEVVAKEAVVDLLKWQATNLTADPADGVKKLGLRMLSERELEQIIDRHIEKNKKLIDERGEGSFSSLMGSVMSEVRGSIEPKQVTETLKRRLAKAVRK